MADNLEEHSLEETGLEEQKKSTNNKSGHLCVDLDGTLIDGDLFYENFFLALKHRPILIFSAIYKGLIAYRLADDYKAVLKHILAVGCKLDVDNLAYNQEVLDLIARAKSEGRKVYLATASHTYLACQIAEHLAVFDGVIATDSNLNMRGQIKADVLVNRFGEKGFDYIGNDKHDIPVWKVASTAYSVNATKEVFKAAKKQGIDLIEVKPYRGILDKMDMVFQTIRPHQWVKNLLVFLPAFMAHNLFSFVVLFKAIIAFVIFSLLASTVYQINDLIDLRNDRRHPYKSKRAIASGKISNVEAVKLSAFMLAVATVGSILFLSKSFFLCFVLYLVLNSFYSTLIKRIIMLDIVVLSFLYVLRVLAGAAATSVEVSPWLLAFSLFIFYSLACIKRYSELFDKSIEAKVIEKSESKKVEQETDAPKPIKKLFGRAYGVSDIQVISNLGVGSGLISVLVLALYLNSKQVSTLYTHPSILWVLTLPLIYWISRLWILAGRGEIHSDPIVFALKDKASYFLAVFIFIVLTLAK